MRSANRGKADLAHYRQLVAFDTAPPIYYIEEHPDYLPLDHSHSHRGFSPMITELLIKTGTISTVCSSVDT